MARFNRRDSSKARNDRLRSLGARCRTAISDGYRPKRAAEHKGAARHRRWKRQRVKPQYGITRRNNSAMPPSQMHTSAHKSSIRIVLEDRGKMRKRHKAMRSHQLVHILENVKHWLGLLFQPNFLPYRFLQITENYISLNVSFQLIVNSL